MKNIHRWDNLIVLFGAIIAFGLIILWINSDTDALSPDTDQRFSRTEQVQIMTECLQDAKKVIRNNGYSQMHREQAELAKAFWEYRTK